MSGKVGFNTVYVKDMEFYWFIGMPLSCITIYPYLGGSLIFIGPEKIEHSGIFPCCMKYFGNYFKKPFIAVSHGKD